MPQSKFISFEGGDGAGKTTQQGLLAKDLAACGLRPLSTREPGGSPAADAVRKLLLARNGHSWDGLAEALLHCAARRTHLVDVVWPALAEGSWVVSDRFADSTLAYQGYGQGVDRATIGALYRIIAGDFRADLTIVLDVPPELGLERTQSRKGAETRYERMTLDFHRRVREGFLDIARLAPDRCAVIDAALATDVIHARIRDIVAERLGVSWP